MKEFWNSTWFDWLESESVQRFQKKIPDPKSFFGVGLWCNMQSFRAIAMHPVCMLIWTKAIQCSFVMRNARLPLFWEGNQFASAEIKHCCLQICRCPGIPLRPRAPLKDVQKKARRLTESNKWYRMIGDVPFYWPGGSLGTLSQNVWSSGCSPLLWRQISRDSASYMHVKYIIYTFWICIIYTKFKRDTL